MIEKNYYLPHKFFFRKNVLEKLNWFKKVFSKIIYTEENLIERLYKKKIQIKKHAKGKKRSIYYSPSVQILIFQCSSIYLQITFYLEIIT